MGVESAGISRSSSSNMALSDQQQQQHGREQLLHGQHSYKNEYQAFAASRSIDYVYVPYSEESFASLDAHVSSHEVDNVLPLVITGEDGIGKNALLSNWARRRASCSHKGEFLFQYFSGASTRSSNLAHMLFQLETALKEEFQLREMEVPITESRLIWSLPRFLEAAAKKNSPSRIVVVIDGVCALKGEQMPKGALHWMPTKLPSGVRFLVSTVEFDGSRGPTRPHKDIFAAAQEEARGIKTHRTFAELQRRKCPILRIGAVDEDCQKKIITAFCSMTESAGVGLVPLSLTEEQIERIVAVAAHPKPLYLRTLLNALQLGAEWAMQNSLDAVKAIDEYLQKYLEADDSLSLTSLILDVCSGFIGEEGQEGGAKSLGAVLSVLYACRDGLTDDEVWGSASIVLGRELPRDQREWILKVLVGNTMLVQDQRSFSHVEFRRVVYNKYVKTPERLITLHTQMAQYFDRLPASDRKVDNLPYHLEVACSWSKLRNCLVDIDMFDIWWTLRHKAAFISLWASLTRGSSKQQPKSAAELPTGREALRQTVGNASEEVKSDVFKRARPCYDIVDEYCRSLDLYRDRFEPSDERVSEMTMKIAEFLLEFATSGNEAVADIPQFVHPDIPSEDLASLGVAHLSADEDGRSVLIKPITQEPCEETARFELPSKSNEDFPECAAYFFRRWMWIQYPFIALANCGPTYLRGIEIKTSQEGKHTRAGGTFNKNPHTQALPGLLLDPYQPEARMTKPRKIGGDKTVSHARTVGDLDDFILLQSTSALAFLPTPDQKNKPKVALGRKDKGAASSGSEQDQYYWQVLTKTIQDDIQSYRAELDSIVRRRATLEPRLQDLLNVEHDLNLISSGVETGEDRMRELKEKEDRVVKRHVHARQLAANYNRLIKMCQRHPAHNPALIDELEIKLDQDSRLVQEVTKISQAETYERVAYMQDFQTLQRAAAEKKRLENAMLESRRRQHEVLQASNEKDRIDMDLANNSSQEARPRPSRSNNGSRISNVRGSVTGHLRIEEQPWYIIKSATGITDPDVFIRKFTGTDALAAQLMELKASAESRLSDLKENFQTLEKEMEDTRYDSLSVGGNKEMRDLHARLGSSAAHLKHAKELAESTESLARSTMTGLLHVSAMLGVAEPTLKPHAEIHVMDLVRQLEFVLDSLMDEKDKSSQKAGGGALPAIGSVGESNNLSGSLESQSSVDLSLARPKEVQAALQQFSMPKTKIAARLLSRLPDEDRDAPQWDPLEDQSDGEDGNEERIAQKKRSEKQVKHIQRYHARLKASVAG